MLALKTFRQILKYSKIPTKAIPSIKVVQEEWDKFSNKYNQFDYCPQTLYYSFLYMLEVWNAKNILQVACGTGKLLPIAVNMKNPNANYLAVDLSPQMIELTKKNLKDNLSLYDSKLSFQQWLKKSRINLQVSNAQLPLKKPEHIKDKFDRIICNCVLMLTEDASKMLTNLNNQAEKGCLMGVSVWGNKDHNNLMTSIRESYLQANIPLPQSRSNFHLYKKVPDLAEKCGWQTVLKWQQNALFPALSINSERYQSFIFHQVQKIENLQQQKKVKEILMNKLKKYFDQQKRGINFSCQMLVLRKK